jgi:hypothetical protein
MYIYVLLVGGWRQRIDKSEVQLLNRPRPTQGCSVNRRRRMCVCVYIYIYIYINIYIYMFRVSYFNCPPVCSTAPQKLRSRSTVYFSTKTQSKPDTAPPSSSPLVCESILDVPPQTAKNKEWLYIGVLMYETFYVQPGNMTQIFERRACFVHHHFWTRSSTFNTPKRWARLKKSARRIRNDFPNRTSFQTTRYYYATR